MAPRCAPGIVSRMIREGVEDTMNHGFHCYHVRT